MPTTTELKTRLQALRAQRDSAVARVSYDGRAVEYRGATEISHAIAELEREIDILQGKTPIRQIRLFTSNPYDGHTLKATANKAEIMIGIAIQRLYADKGYRGHDYVGDAKVMISGNKRGLTPTMKRELKRRSAIEPMIGHAKNDGRLGRNYLLRTAGDKINAILAAAAGHNLRLVLKRLVLLLVRIRAVVHMIAVMNGICTAKAALTA